jgi:hypothetical protein
MIREARGEDSGSPGVVLGRDGMHFTLPSDSETIFREELG